MAKDQTIQETVKSLFNGLEYFVSSKTVVGESIKVDDALIIPLVDVQFGVGAGAFLNETKERGAGGMTGKMSPSAVLVIKDGYSKLINVKTTGTVNKVLDMVPDLVDRFTKKDSKEVKEAIKDIENEVK